MTIERVTALPDRPPRAGLGAAVALTENLAAALALLAMAVLPVIELLVRNLFEAGVPGSFAIVANLTLWTAFCGAMIATRDRSHLTLAFHAHRGDRARRARADIVVGFVTCGVAAMLAWSGAQYVRALTEIPQDVARWLPLWLVQLIVPLAFAVIALRSIAQAGTWPARLTVAAAIPLVVAVGHADVLSRDLVLWCGLAGLLLATGLGAPVFVLIGGAALLLLYSDGVPIAAVAAEMHRIVGSPAIPTIPLYALTGYVLAQPGTSERLVRLFRAWFGWMPGGLAIAAAMVCAFFSAFTGASGVTILALGGLLLPVLVRQGYGERFSLGLLTATGSIGLLFPPSLAVIVYAVVARIPIPDLFLAGLLPGACLVLFVAVYGVRRARAAGIRREAFAWRPAWQAMLDCRWELFLPVVTLAGLFGGFCTLAEAAAITAVYAIAVQLFVHRELNLRGLLEAARQCATLVGGVLIILASALGLTNWIVDAEIPDSIAEAIGRLIESPWLFLLALNLILLAVGCLMDIFSATVIVVPLMIPVATHFGIEPLHLALIFLVNLELGYLTPPIGLNLFLASYRFERPLLAISRSILPFAGLYLGVLALVTYLPLLLS